MMSTELHKSVQKQLFETSVRYALRQTADSSEGSHLVSVRFEKVPDKTNAGKIIVRAVVRGPNPPLPAQVAEMEAQLPSPPRGETMELRIRFVETTIINRDGLLYGDVRFATHE